MNSPTFQHQRKFYETYWKDSKRLSIDEKCRKRFVLSALSRFGGHSKKPLRILDVGCGRGWMTDALMRYGEVLGADLFVEEARQRYPGAAFEEMNIVSQFPKGVYDIVVSSEVIEHLPKENQAEHIRHIADVLPRGGLLILTTPNKPQLESLVKKLKDTSHMQPLENWLDKGTIREMAEPYFEIEQFGSARFYPVFLFSNIFLRVPYHILYDYLSAYALFDKILQTTNWGTYFTLVGKKR